MTRHREDKALEVFLDDTHVGWIAGENGARLRSARLTISEMPSLRDATDPRIPVMARTFEIAPLVFSVRHDHYEKSHIAYGSRFLQKVAPNVPLYAERHRDEARMLVVFEWRVLKCATTEEFDWLFDQKCFLPADSEHDVDLAADRRAMVLASEEFEEMRRSDPPTFPVSGATSREGAERLSRFLGGSSLWAPHHAATVSSATTNAKEPAEKPVFSLEKLWAMADMLKGLDK